MALDFCQPCGWVSVVASSTRWVFLELVRLIAVVTASVDTITARVISMVTSGIHVMFRPPLTKGRLLAWRASRTMLDADECEDDDEANG
jgi:hypothetical protein